MHFVLFTEKVPKLFRDKKLAINYFHLDVYVHPVQTVEMIQTLGHQNPVQGIFHLKIYFFLARIRNLRKKNRKKIERKIVGQIKEKETIEELYLSFMNTFLSGVVSVSLACATCQQKTENKRVQDTTPLSQEDLQALSHSIQSQYKAILETQNTQESLVIDLHDKGASLVINRQDQKITMVQLTLRNPYPNDPDMAPTPYTDIHGDGLLETFPADTKTLPQSLLTYGNYLALLTRFGMLTEVRQEEKILPKKSHKAQEFNVARDAISPSPEVFSHISQ